MSAQETHVFKSEARELLDLMIHSLYSNREIFLRELISNASDACDKLRFEALSDAALFENDAELKISISVDNDAKTLTIRDNGIGMAREAGGSALWLRDAAAHTEVQPASQSAV